MISVIAKHVSYVSSLCILFLPSCGAEQSIPEQSGSTDEIAQSLVQRSSLTVTYEEAENSPSHRFDPNLPSSFPEDAVSTISTGSDIYRIVSSKKGSEVVSWSSNTKMISVWDARTLQRVNTFPIDIPVSNYDDAIALDGNELTINGFKKRAVWNYETGVKLRGLPSRPERITTASGRSVSAAINSGHAKVWDSDERELVFPDLTEKVDHIRLSPNGAYLAVAIDGIEDSTKGGRAQIWIVATGQLLTEIAYGRASFTLLRFAPDNRTFVAGAYTGRVVVWDLATNQPRYSLQTGTGLRSVEISPDGTLLATTGRLPAGTGNYEGVAVLWDLQSGAQRHVELFSELAGSTAFSPVGTQWAASSWDGTLVVMDYSR